MWVRLFNSMLSCFARTASIAERLTRVPCAREVWSSNPELAKYYTSLQTVRHHFNIYASKWFGAILQRWAPQTRYTIRTWYLLVYLSIIPWSGDSEGTVWWWWWCYPTPSEEWGHGGTLRRPNSRATPHGLDHR